MSKAVQIAGVEFDKVTYAQALERVEVFMQSKEQHYGVTPNPEMVLYANHHPHFRSILNASILSVADGTGILWAAYFFKKTAGKSFLFKAFFLPFSLMAGLLFPPLFRSVLPQRVTGADLFLKIIPLAEKHQWPVFLLGAAPGVAEKAAKKLRKKYPPLLIVGTHAGSPNPQDWPEIHEKILHASPALLFVAYGSPAQEVWITEHLKELPSVRFAMGIGGTFDFVAGRVRRAPKVFQIFGLEWLWRLFLQPSRLPRILNATWHFISLIFKKSLQ